jgi:hypothetical protein
MKRKARKECHGSGWLCCQYCDTPQCNSNRDPHLLGRLVWRWNQRKEWRRHEDGEHTVPLKLIGGVGYGTTRWYKDPFRRKS